MDTKRDQDDKKVPVDRQEQVSTAAPKTAATENAATTQPSEVHTADDDTPPPMINPTNYDERIKALNDCIIRLNEDITALREDNARIATKY
ncbi:unnamed protein product [Periconia digitata]|uniref:Uncharacterized protein n=1 Tax=Periconia digitata TaxID=1303443 RepID=A0A9W4UPU5_9PLEO|nr:unnamed protein product [Periconia digitata]